MTCIIHRSATKHWFGFEWPAEIAYTIGGKAVTFAELKAERVAKQREHLQYAVFGTGTPQRRAAHIWAFYVPGWIYGGWHLYLRTVKEKWWIRECDDFALDIMRRFPCGLLPIPENFYAWKAAFAKEYARPSIRRSKQGMVPGWVEVMNGRRPDAFYC